MLIGGYFFSLIVIGRVTLSCYIKYLSYFYGLIIHLKKITHMTTVESVGYLASLLSIINQIPQAIKVFRSKDTHSISIVMYFLVVLCLTMWMLYGVLLHDGPLVWANLLSLIPITYIFSMKIRNTIIGKDKWAI